MTSYSAMAARGRAEARDATAGRRKQVGDRIEWGEKRTSGYTTQACRLIGTCGHMLLWEWVPVYNDDPQVPRRLSSRLGRRVTCPHDDCRIPEHVYTDADCTYLIGEAERRCTTRAAWDTTMGRLCTRHRNHYRNEGYLDDHDGTPIPRPAKTR